MKTKSILLLTIFLVVGGIVQAQYPFTNGLIAYYPFRGNANDESGNGHNAVAMGAGLQLTNGVGEEPNSAYRGLFAGNTNNLAAAGVNLSNSSLTITMWFKKDYQPYTIDHGSIVTLGTQSSSGKQLHIRPYYSGVQFRFSFFNDDFDVSTPVGNGDWTHIACTYDNATKERRIYFDGNLIATNIAVAGYTGNSTLLLIPAGLGNAPSGLIDNTRFYNRVLSANEITELYEYESGPWIDLIKAVKPALKNLALGANYQLQLSGDLSNWTNHGSPFTATNINMVYPQYWDVDNWGELFFRLQVVP